ncbi:nuclear RNA export factor 1-like isoform X1 [Venturia canescens]|uniref:nuclear RNA export factor 1-like isoform X1 n=1 Tax=Venturia canescens TaxID=32260 RepID=UPI001C9C574B|nr:nuclear RNA export factor 1-like isoform X1 [Venturia canescens]
MAGQTQPLTSKKAVVLDFSSAIKLSIGSQMTTERALMAKNDAWHRIMITRGAKYDREMILRTIVSAVEPADLIPVRYQVVGEDAYFIARNCGAALETLCRSNLIISIPNGDSIILTVTLAFASIHELKINIQPIVLAALTRRYNSDLKYLNLDNFHRDPEVERTVYCPLSQPKTLSHTLKLAKTALGPVEHLSLKRNNLTHLHAMENSNLMSLKSLDIRHNNLLVMNPLSSLKNLSIEELLLDGNPLCENYATEKRYIEAAKLYCPHLKKLDGVDLEPLKLPTFRDNYYQQGSVSRKIVDQFLTHFFGIYDYEDRSLLSPLYSRNSLYSLTLGITAECQKHANFGAFSSENRNLLDTRDLRKFRRLLYHGGEEIVNAFKKLPETLHDRRNFRYDVMWEDHRRLLVSIEGMFKTTSNSSVPNGIYAFSRTFLLVGRVDNEYNVLNDQYHISVPHPLAMVFFDLDNSAFKETNGNKNTLF